jgi:phosphatidylserine/phosphatidylglycerophosphate/cardiolipin synthase-like enzyme
MMKVIFSIFVLLSLSLNAQTSYYFMPDDSKQAVEAFLDSIKKSKKSIKASIYSFTRKDFAKALSKVAKRGVKVDIIFDEESNNRKNKRSQLRRLAKYKNINIYTTKGKLSRSGKYYGKLHTKVMVIDNKRVIFGSANWSKSAFSTSYEVMAITDDYAVAKKFENYLDKIKNGAKLYR